MAEYVVPNPLTRAFRRSAIPHTVRCRYVAVKTSHTPASQAAAVVNDMEITEEDAL